MNLPQISRLMALVLVSLAQPVQAQLAPAPDAPPIAHQTQEPGQTSMNSSSTEDSQPRNSHNLSNTPLPIFHATANLVNLFFLARGQHNKLVPNLTQADCTVDEDSTKQVLQNFTSKSDLPLTIGILLDTSLSQQHVLSAEQQAAAAFLRRILRPKDEAFLIGFDVDVTLLADLTGSPRDLKRAIEDTGINSATGNYANGTIPSIGKPKGTLLYDAVYLAANDKLRHEAGRKALILLTNGEDEGSQTRLKSAIEAAQKANAIVYVLLIQDPGIYSISDDYGTGPMRKLAVATGGQVFKIGANGRKMEAAFEEIESELRTQYQATYTPTNSKKDGTYRHIHIDCRQNGQHLHVQARQGYYAEPATESRP